MLNLTLISGGADVVEQRHDEIQVHPLVIKAVVVLFEELLFFTAQLCRTALYQRWFLQAAHFPQRSAQKQNNFFAFNCL